VVSGSLKRTFSYSRYIVGSNERLIGKVRYDSLIQWFTFS